jgi:hypothetical protein
MRPVIHRTIRLGCAFLALACFAIPAGAASPGGASPELRLPSFSHLQHQATEVVDLTIGSWPLAILGGLMNEDDPQDAAMKTVLKGIKRVVVRSYRFDSDFVYSKADVAAVRSQLSAPVWTQLVQVRDERHDKNVDIYVAMDHEKIAGFVIIATEPHEFTILNVVGSVEPAQVARLRSKLDLPEIVVADIPGPSP